jgi:hypothetical protein
MWKTTKQSIKLIREEIILSYPPKLRVHSVFFDGDRANKTWHIQCSIDNIGGSKAIIKKRSLAFKVLEEPLSGILPYSEPLLIEKTLESATNIIGTTEQISFDTEIFWDAIQTDPFRHKFLYFFGYIDYSDSNGIIRRIAFCRRYDENTQSFTKVENEDYEYSY